MNGKARFATLLVGALSCVSITALAADPAANAKAEAAQRFDRGLKLFDEGDNAGALAEFKQVYATMPNPVVLYNIGLVYAAMGRPVEAVDSLKGVVNESSLSKLQHERAVSTLADQQARIGRLNITTLPSGARISIDNVDVATTPLSAPLRVAAGSHVVGAVAAGFALARKEVVVAGDADATVDFQLVRADAQRDANLTVRSRVPGAEVLIDGKSAGKTPLSTSLAIPAGHHGIELRRPGYTSAKQDIDLVEGATGEVSLDPSVDNRALSTEGVLFSVDVGRRAAELFVDQQHLGPYTAPVRLPKGPHRVRVEAAGFLPLERDMLLDPGKTNVLSEKLEPTPETRAAHDANVSFHRTWGLIGIGAGALIAGGGIAWLAVNSGSKSDARSALEKANDDLANHRAPNCSLDVPVLNCQAFVDGKQSDYDDAKKKDIVGYVGIGVGAAALVTGVVILLTGEKADEYNAARARPRFALASGPGNAGLGLSGWF